MTQTLEQPQVRKLDPDATYTAEDLAAYYGVTVRQLHRWRKDRRKRFPKPFGPGRVPSWKGFAIVGWEERRQQEAMV
jgi:hypothetical protein